MSSMKREPVLLLVPDEARKHAQQKLGANDNGLSGPMGLDWDGMGWVSSFVCSSDRSSCHRHCHCRCVSVRKSSHAVNTYSKWVARDSCFCSVHCAVQYNGMKNELITVWASIQYRSTRPERRAPAENLCERGGYLAWYFTDISGETVLYSWVRLHSKLQYSTCYLWSSVELLVAWSEVQRMR